MNLIAVSRILSIMLLMLTGFILIPALMSLYYGSMKLFLSFAIPGAVTASAGSLFLLLTRGKIHNITIKDSFLFVTLSWVLASLYGSIPFILSGSIPSFTDAFFETISGFSTTGASILTDIEVLPKPLLFWRALTHWLGGMGIVVLTVAILPMLGIGGLQMVDAEAPGPTVDKITPRITETAKILWIIYFGFTILQTILLYIAGMDLFDSVTHTFATLGTGGYSTKNASVGHYNSPYIHWIITVFMLLAGISFNNHYRILTGRWKQAFRDSELRFYLFIVAASTLLIAVNLKDTYQTAAGNLQYAAFQTASIITTTGFATADYEKWPFFSQAILFILMFIGGCSGSTGGGIKVIRIVTLLKQAFNEMRLMIHPRGVFTLKMSGSPVRKNIVYAISGFFFLYILILLFITLIISYSGSDLITSFSAALATLGNIGPGFGKVGPTQNFSHFSDHVKWVFSFAMLIGRLELYTVLVILTPGFWK